MAPLKSLVDSGRALIGAHLHPWVSPPFEEEVNARNSYPGNLPPALEREKLRLLTERIEASFGTRPRTYLAGRYGFGPHTGAILEELGYEVDISPAVPIDFSADGGPDYSAFTSDPIWFGDRMLGLPGTAGTSVGCGRAARRFTKLTSPLMRRTRLAGAVARLGLLSASDCPPRTTASPRCGG